VQRIRFVYWQSANTVRFPYAWNVSGRLLRKRQLPDLMFDDDLLAGCGAQPDFFLRQEQMPCCGGQGGVVRRDPEKSAGVKKEFHYRSPL
jgi:hypothetical protein